MCLCDQHSSRSLVVIPLFHILKAMGDTEEDRHTRLRNLPYVEYLISLPMYWMINRARLSVCSLDWKEKEGRDSTAVTILADVYSEAHAFPVAYYFLIIPTVNAPPRIIPHGSTAYADFYGTYGFLSTPSRAGTTVISYYNNTRDDVHLNRMLVTFSGNEVRARQIEPIYLQGTQAPATRSLFVEPYSGAVFYATANSEAVVIYHFD